MSESKNWSLGELAHHLSCQLIGDHQYLINDVSDLKTARKNHLSFFNNARYLGQLATTGAGAIIIQSVPNKFPNHQYLLCNDPSLAFEQAVKLFRKPLQSGFQGVHSTAVIHATAHIEENVEIGPYCVIDQKAVISRGSRLIAHVFVGAQTIIGANCQIHPHVVLREGCILGDNVVLQPGAVVGSCGFGFTSSSSGHRKETQAGNVLIEEDVEIGALTAVDRSRIGQTIVGKGTKIDNLVQIAHNVKVGPNNLIAAQVGLAGSCATGNFVTIAGQAALVGHIKISDNITLAARAGVSKNLYEKGVYAGVPATSLNEWKRQIIHIKQLPDFKLRLNDMNQRLNRLERVENSKSNE